MVFVAVFLLIANIIIRLIAKKIWSKRPAAAGEDAAAPSKARPVERIWLDNPVFFLIRVWVFKLDNVLFNRRNAVGPDYQPPRMVLVLPYWFGLIGLPFAIIAEALFFYLYGVEEDVDHNELKSVIICWHTFCLPFTVIVNTILFRGNAFVFLDRTRRTLYLCYTAICSMLAALVGFWTLPMIVFGGMGGFIIASTLADFFEHIF